MPRIPRPTRPRTIALRSAAVPPAPPVRCGAAVLLALVVPTVAPTVAPAGAARIGPGLPGNAAETATQNPAATAAATVTGEVRDPQGLLVAGARVVLTLANGEVRETESDAAGVFAFPGVPRGTHRLTISRPNFAARSTAVAVEGAGEVRLSLTLDLAYAEEVLVRGQQQERPLRAEPGSVAVADGARLDAGTDSDLYRLVAMTPNVNSSSEVRGFSIRGIAQSGFASEGGLLVNVQVDGAAVQGYQGSFFGPFGTWDLDRVEIFRGPQSTQQGRNALGGAIVVRSADPVYRTEIRGRVRLGSAAAAHTSAVVNLPLLPERAALRVAFDRRTTEGFVSAPTRGEEDYDARTARNLRAKLRFDPSPRFRGLLTVAETDSRGGDSTIAADRFPGERVTLADHPAEDGSRHRFATLEWSWLLTDAFSLESSSSLYLHEYRREEDLDRTPAPAGVLDYTTDDRWATGELRLRYAGPGGRSGVRRGVLGVHLADLDDRLQADAAGPGELAGLPPGFVLTSFFTTKEQTRNAALFGETDLDLGPAGTLTLGARYDFERRETENTQGVVAEPAHPSFPGDPTPGTPVEASYRAFLPKVALTRALGPAVSVSASWQRGYRAGGRSVAVLSQEVSDFDPEFTDNYEFALRAEASDRRSYFHANLFHTDWRDQQVRVLTPLGLPVDTLTVNAGKSTLRGAEAQAGYWLLPEVGLHASAGLLRTQFDDFRDGQRDFTGNEFPHAPPWSLFAGVSVRFADSWSGSAEFGAQGESFSDSGNDPRFRVGSRALLNARFGYRRGPWGVFAFGRNLLDRAYLYEAWAPTAPLPGAFGRAGAPRTVGIELDFRY